MAERRKRRNGKNPGRSSYGSSRKDTDSLSFIGRRLSSPSGSKGALCLAFLLSLLSLLVLNASPLSALERLIRYGMMELPPLFFKGEGGRYEGYFPDLLELLAEGEPWRISLVEGHGDELLPMLERGELDLLSMASTLALERRVDFADVHHYATWYTFFTRDDREILAFQDLDGKRLSIQGGFYALYELRRILDRLAVACEIVETRTMHEALGLLRRGDVDVCAAEQMTTANLVRRYGLRRSPVIFAPSRIVFATTKGKNGDLLARLDEKLALLQSHPLSPLKNLQRRWFYDEEFAFFPSWALSAFVIGFLLLGLALLCLIAVYRKDRIIGQRNEELEEHLALERFLAEAAQLLLSSGVGEEELREAFARVGEMTRARRLLLLRSSLSTERRRFLEIRYAYGSPEPPLPSEGLEEGKVFVDDVPVEWLTELNRKKIVEDGLPEPSSGEPSFPRADEGRFSFYALCAGNHLWGALAFQPLSGRGRERTEALLRTLSEMISAHLLRRKEARRLLRRATTDDLTGLPNRKVFFESLERETARALRHGRPLSVILCDIDFFKSVNDTYGHDSGDKVLRQLARRLRKSLRAEDLPARLGGEEFGILLPETDLVQACRAAERLRQEVEGTDFVLPRLREGLFLRITASFGTASFHGPSDKASALFIRADRAMYRAKEEGRNRVESEEGLPSLPRR